MWLYEIIEGGSAKYKRSKRRKMQTESIAENKSLGLVDALRDFMPMVAKQLALHSMPKIIPVHTLKDAHSFGKYDPNTHSVELCVHDRHPVDILRTLAHELAHHVQSGQHRLTPSSGQTGSGVENEANAIAGIIMRNFSNKYPKYLKLPVVSVK